MPRVAKPKNYAPALAAGVQSAPPDGTEERRRRIAEAAYFRAQGRGFAPGADLDDWLAAEREIDGYTPKE